MRQQRLNGSLIIEKFTSLEKEAVLLLDKIPDNLYSLSKKQTKLLFLFKQELTNVIVNLKAYRERFEGLLGRREENVDTRIINMKKRRDTLKKLSWLDKLLYRIPNFTQEKKMNGKKTIDDLHHPIDTKRANVKIRNAIGKINFLVSDAQKKVVAIDRALQIARDREKKREEVKNQKDTAVSYWIKSGDIWK